MNRHPVSLRSGQTCFWYFTLFWGKFGTRSSWLNCALRDDETVNWVSIGHYEAVAIGNWWHWVSRGHLCLYISYKVEIWSDVTDALLTDWLTVTNVTTLKDSATQLRYKSGALLTQQVIGQIKSTCVAENRPLPSISQKLKIYLSSCMMKNLKSLES